MLVTGPRVLDEDDILQWSTNNTSVDSYKARLGVLVLGECSMHYNVCVLCGIYFKKGVETHNTSNGSLNTGEVLCDVWLTDVELCITITLEIGSRDECRIYTFFSIGVHSTISN